jgi:tetratricopeptide (TPR) repeat protein
MHPVVHKWASYIQTDQVKEEFIQLAIMIVGYSLPNDLEQNSWILQQRLLPHVDICSSWARKPFTNMDTFGHGKVIDSLRWIGLYNAQSRLQDAEAMYKLSFQISETLWGSEHQLTLEIVNNLGIIYEAQLRLDDAKTMFEQALRGYERLFVLDDVSTLETLNNLAIVYRLQGRLEESLKLHKRALEGKERILVSKHPTTLSSLHNLGVVCFDKGLLQKPRTSWNRRFEATRRRWVQTPYTPLTPSRHLALYIATKES